MDIDDEFVSIGRSIDIELGSHEVITIDLDNLDSNPEDVLELLRDGQCRVWVWTKLTGEYWRSGFSFKMNGKAALLPPIYSLLANIQIDHSRRAPKLILPNAREDIMTNQKSNEEYHREAASLINAASTSASEASQSGEPAISTELAFLTRGTFSSGIQQLATGHMNKELCSFKDVLATKPTKLVALLGKVPPFESLSSSQDCIMLLRYQAKAKVAWERSLELIPSDWTAQLLLDWESLNSSKDGHLKEEEQARLFLSGTQLIEKAFNANQKNKGELKRALKLAERTIQFAHTLPLLTEGHLRAGRVLHAEGNFLAATPYYSSATEGQLKHVLAAIGLAQMPMNNGRNPQFLRFFRLIKIDLDEPGGAIKTLNNVLQAPNPQESLEATMKEKMEALRKEAEKLAQERRLAREQALEWTREARMNESEEEKEKSPKKAKKSTGDGTGSGDEGKIRKANGEPTEEGEKPATVFLGEDEAERPTKKPTKKRVVGDHNEDEVQTGPQRKKQL
ncbi:uncharacterized protein C8R40DRAFT_1066987 [Lentinula edodes]|uniref:uncharacterized protein n=1 Tax=Lentinula edodes TaxID=5353 RepID=UPI001E8E7E6B|nr:uncharacterized protein C8R40DRAFT_1066987 [Lentinula edodes]KAH7878549.1 hypothetical protein C8R40DRAFT_1066987 [Lentinula edodes]